MGYQQIIQPNWGAVSPPGYCLGLATSVFFGGAGGYEWATQAWDASPTKNGSRDMPSVAVPVWFSWWGNINGTYQDWGHVVVYNPSNGKFLSSPGRWSDGVGQQWFNSIQEIENWFGARYNGWTLDIMPNGTVAAATDGPTPGPTPTPQPDWNATYTVVSGDTLSGIADNYGISWEALYAANTDVIGGDPNSINPGMVLRVPGTTPTPSPEPTPAPAPSGTTYEVQPGDDLWGIAERFYGTANWDNVGQIAAVNGIENPALIFPGQTLTIPGV